MLLTSLLAGLSIHAQITTITVDSKVDPYGICNVLYYKAPSKITNPKTVVFVPGMGQHKSPSTTNSTDGLLKYEGPLVFVQSKSWRPDFNIIVLQPSEANDEVITETGVLNEVTERRYFQFVKNMLEYIVTPTNPADFPLVQKDKIYLTGLSLGAHYIHSYIKHSANTDIKPQAMVTMSIAMPSSLDGYSNFHQIPAWAFIGSKDVDKVPEDYSYMKGSSFFSTMSGFWMMMKDAGWPNKHLTIYDGEHDKTVSADGQKGWQYFYNPANQFPEVTTEPYFKLATTVLNSNPSVYDWMLRYPIVDPLPVTFHSFKVQHITTETILQWSTASETNNAYFVIERSEDGIHFTEVGRVETKAPEGNSTSILSYIFKLFNK
jgi:hypothetical protein